jgi:hypothetical protein
MSRNPWHQAATEAQRTQSNIGSHSVLRVSVATVGYLCGAVASKSMVMAASSDDVSVPSVSLWLGLCVSVAVRCA